MKTDFKRIFPLLYIIFLFGNLGLKIIAEESFPTFTFPGFASPQGYKDTVIIKDNHFLIVFKNRDSKTISSNSIFEDFPGLAKPFIRRATFIGAQYNNISVDSIQFIISSNEYNFKIENYKYNFTRKFIPKDFPEAYYKKLNNFLTKKVKELHPNKNIKVINLVWNKKYLEINGNLLKKEKLLKISFK